MAEEPGPHGRGRERPDGAVRARAESCTGLAGTARSTPIVMARTVAGLVAGGTRIDTAEAVDMSYPGFFREMEGLGVIGGDGVR